MTTAARDTSDTAHRAGAVVLAGAALAMLGAGAVVVVLGALFGGGDAALGAVAATALVSVILVTGSMVVELTARAVPGASLLVAMLTYTLEVVLLAAVLVALRGSPAAMDRISAPWFAAAVIACALVWTVGQVVLTMRTRIPVYDLPDAGAENASGSLAEVSDR